MSEITIKEFITLLSEHFSPQLPLQENIVKYAHQKGWIEDQDEVNQNNPIDKRTAARIIHQFMKIQLKILDTKDITPAEILKDLYTCRVCVNHVSQVFVKGIMNSEEIQNPTTDEIVQIFNMTRILTREEVEQIILRLRDIVADSHYCTRSF